MKITLEFNSIEELMASAKQLEQLALEHEVGVTAMAEDKKKTLTAKELNESAKKTAEIINAAEAKMDAEKAEKKAKEKAKKEVPFDEDEEPEGEIKPIKKKEEPKVGYDALRVECRKVLAALNKATGKNSAGEIVKSHGAQKLSDVKDMFLPALLGEAKEALADAE